jgi:hypothetical protein
VWGKEIDMAHKKREGTNGVTLLKTSNLAPRSEGWRPKHSKIKAKVKSRKSSKKKKQILPISKEWVSPHRAAKEEYIGQYEYDKRQRKQKELERFYGSIPHPRTLQGY